MEIGLILIFLGACCMRHSRRDEDAVAYYPQKQSAPGFWQRVSKLWNPRVEAAIPEGPGVPQKGEDAESKLQIRQEVEKDSERVWTRISYRGEGKSVNVKCQENITLEFAGIVFKLEPGGVKAQEARKDRKGPKVLPLKAAPKAAEERIEDAGQEAYPEQRAEQWSGF
jgi:hypothetical protein